MITILWRNQKTLFLCAWLSMFLIACSGSPPEDKTVESRTSFELIDEALEKGIINYETALSYKVYVVFGDERLPKEYHGVDEWLSGTSTMMELVANFEKLSPEAQANLNPFLMTPPEPGSWYELREGQARGLKSTAIQWATVTGKVAKVKVWWDQGNFPQDKANAQMIADELDSTIWPKLTSLMREPLPDCGSACPRGGGDTKLDIYLVFLPTSTNGLTHPFSNNPLGNLPTSSYIEVNRTIKNLNSLLGTVTHEFMHAIQVAYLIASWAEYRWLLDATANWAIDYVYSEPNMKGTNAEHESIPWFLDHPETPLETVNKKHEYGAYLFFFYLHRKFGQPEIIRQVWENATKPDSLDAVNAAIPGGFKERWHEFALLNLNNPPRVDYGKWDQISPSIKPKYEKTLDLTLTGDYEEYLETNVKHLSALYHLLNFPNKENRFISIKNPFATGNWPTAKVQAVFKIAGQQEWKWEDWTTFAQKDFCRDRPEEDIEKLVLISSNSEWQNRNHELGAGDILVETKQDCFAIDRIEGPSSLVYDAGPGNFSVFWKGKPTFPVVLTLKNVACGIDKCANEIVVTYGEEENPLPFRYECYTFGDPGEPPAPGGVSYETRLNDSKGLETPPATFTTSCQN
jgi:hypothetical protein